MLYVYPDRADAITDAELLSAFRAAGAEAALWTDLEAFQPAPGGPVRNGAILTAWGAALPTAAQVAAVLADRDREALFRLYAEEAVATCTLLVEDRFRLDAHYRPDELAELEGWSDPALFAVMRRATRRYTVVTWPGCSPLSQSLQWMLWVSLGELCRGVLEDPQTGDVLAAWALASFRTAAEPGA